MSIGIQSDPQSLPGAYVTDGTHLYEVIDHLANNHLVLEDCASGRRTQVASWRLRFRQWREVRPAPRLPDTDKLAPPPAR